MKISILLDNEAKAKDNSDIQRNESLKLSIDTGRLKNTMERSPMGDGSSLLQASRIAASIKCVTSRVCRLAVHRAVVGVYQERMAANLLQFKTGRSTQEIVPRLKINENARSLSRTTTFGIDLGSASKAQKLSSIPRARRS